MPVAVDGDTVAVKVTESPNVDGFLPDPTPVVVVSGLTTCARVLELLPSSLMSPPYTAEMLCEPPLNNDVVSVAVPELSVPVPRLVTPSKKVTVPVAVDGATVAVKVMESPNVDGFSPDATTIVVLPGVTAWLRAVEMLPASSVSPA